RCGGRNRARPRARRAGRRRRCRARSRRATRRGRWGGIVDAVQPDGREASRDSGRLIDYVLVGDGLRAVASEIYDSRDESFVDGVTKAGEPLARTASRLASDHFPVVVDLRPQ
ncbi:MAG: hypothetical protein AAF602_26735, partial [Myxococcota bacterium]